ncbi:MAG: DUF1294 domain-containing protein [Clostridium sp.]
MYLIIINVITFLLMYVDKNRARKKLWRIQESTLFTLAIIGGSLGEIIGMYAFRHKTKHLSFKLGLPLILIIELVITFKLIL